MVFGTFDLLHPGHVFFLEQAKKLGTMLVAVIARDETVERVKGRLPEHDAAQRQRNLIKLGIAHKVILGNLGDKLAVVREEKPQVIALGYDQNSIVENLAQKVGSDIKIVRLAALRPERYKSSKLRNA
jgi:cytidyltransferase-like protein